MTACGPVYGHDLYRLKTIPIRFPGCGYYLRWYYNGWHYWFFLPGQSTFQTEGENYRTLGTRTIVIGSGQITLGECATIRTIMNTREVEIYTDSGWANVRIEPGSAIVNNNYVNGYEIELTATLGSRAISKATGYTPIQNIPLVPPVPDPTICQTIIGTQIWMCKNYDIDFPGSKVYNNDETNRSLYGGLYTKAQVNTPGFCPTGWHVPTAADWQTLFTFIGGVINGGYKLKSLGNTYWLPSGTGNDTYGFDARGAGLYSTAFVLLKQYAKFWIGGKILIGNPNTVELADSSDDIGLIAPSVSLFQSVRLVCDLAAPIAPMGTPTPLVIGTQTWSAKNWDYAYSGSKVYDNNEANRAIYGGLYSYAEIMASDFCPAGWHIPTIAEWNTLIAFVGGAGVAGDKLKEVGNTHWNSPSAGTDDYGFAALPGGNFEVIYSEMGNNVSFMSATDVNSGTSAGKGIFYNFGMVFDGTYCHPTGSVDTFFGSVRFVHD